jgi:hypothetical protein
VGAILFFLIRYFPRSHFQCYPKGPPYPPPPIPYLPTPPFWPWRSPVLGHIQFACPMGLSFQWWPIRPSFVTYAAKDNRVLVSSYCCSTYRVAVPFSSLGTFSSSSIGGRVTHPIADCDHPLNVELWGWRLGSAVQNAYSTFRGPRFWSQSLHGRLKIPVTNKEWVSTQVISYKPSSHLNL